ncbi:hypothetical protein T4D_4115 [Trichinella pseudospiralis]|uniref:Uncharacterized protein n=1 Tax=Trichinella pseudospiralis TaxID=6337 RepID=A0A0V1DQZ0_TRIPS|nr:hypothetical protein T4D_4115 [Trichinella pseudospiralis]
MLAFTFFLVSEEIGCHKRLACFAKKGESVYF